MGARLYVGVSFILIGILIVNSEDGFTWRGATVDPWVGFFVSFFGLIVLCSTIKELINKNKK